jgi:hypothetical protein
MTEGRVRSLVDKIGWCINGERYILGLKDVEATSRRIDTVLGYGRVVFVRDPKLETVVRSCAQVEETVFADLVRMCNDDSFHHLHPVVSMRMRSMRPLFPRAKTQRQSPRPRR